MKRSMILAALGAMSVWTASAMATPVIIDDGGAGSSVQGDFYSASYAPTPGKAYNDDYYWTRPQHHRDQRVLLVAVRLAYGRGV